MEQLITAAVAHPELLTFDKAQASMNDLTTLQQRILSERALLAHEGITLTSVGIGTGVVEVGIAETSSRAVGLLEQRYGAHLIHVRLGVTYKPFATRQDPPPLYGGMEVNDGTYECTNGYIGARVINGIAYYQLLTAGHCFAYLNRVYHQVAGEAPYPEGQVNFNSYYSGSSADTETASLTYTGTGFESASNSIITETPYTHTVDFLEQNQLGQLPVCLSGIETEQTCGFSISATHVTVTDENGVTLNDQVEACCDSAIQGDSGGPVYHYYQAQSINAEGTLFAGQTQNGNYDGTIVFTFIQDALSALGGSFIVCTRTPQISIC